MSRSDAVCLMGLLAIVGMLGLLVYQHKSNEGTEPVVSSVDTEAPEKSECVDINSPYLNLPMGYSIKLCYDKPPELKY